MHRRQGGGDVENVRAPPCGLQRGDEKGTLCSIDDTVDNPEHRDVGGGRGLVRKRVRRVLAHLADALQRPHVVPEHAVDGERGPARRRTRELDRGGGDALSAFAKRARIQRERESREEKSVARSTAGPRVPISLAPRSGAEVPTIRAGGE